MQDCILFLSLRLTPDAAARGLELEGVREVSLTETFLQRSNHNRVPILGTIRSVPFLTLVEMNWMH